MPSPSYFPFMVACGLLVLASSLLITLALIPVGLLIMIAGVYGWSFEEP